MSPNTLIIAASAGTSMFYLLELILKGTAWTHIINDHYANRTWFRAALIMVTVILLVAFGSCLIGHVVLVTEDALA